MRTPSARRRFTAVVLSTTAFGGLAAAAGAQEPISGFTARGAQMQRAYEERFQQGVSPDVIGSTSRALSVTPQLIATPGVRRAFEYSVQLLRSYGLDVSTPGYGVYASRPRDIRVTMTAPETRRLSNKERPFPWHRDFDDVVVGYNAYSPSGRVSGEVVYANYGLPDDYAELERLGVDVRGKIVLVRYGQSFRGVKAQQAEERGAIGLLIYSDPEDDGFVRGPVYPAGPWRPADGIQRGLDPVHLQLSRRSADPRRPFAARDAPAGPEQRGQPAAHPHDADLLWRRPPAARRARRAGRARGVPRRSADHVPRRARRDARAARSRHRLRAAPGPERARRDPRGLKPRERVVIGAHYDGWTYGTSDNTSGWTTIMEIGRSLGRLLRARLAARPHDRARRLGRRGVRPPRLHRVGRAVQARSRPRCGRLRESRRRGRPQLRGGGRAADRRRADRSDPGGGRSAHRAARSTTCGRATTPRSRPSTGSAAAPTTPRSSITSACRRSRPASARRRARARITRRTTTRTTWSVTSIPAISGTRGRRASPASPRCGSPMREVLPFHYSDYAAAVASYVQELQQVQAETPGAAQVELAPLLEAAEAWRRRLRAARRRASTRCSRRETPIRAGGLARINDALMRQERALTTSRGLPGTAMVPPPDLRARPGDRLRRAVPARHARRGRAGRREDGPDIPRSPARLAARGDATGAAREPRLIDAGGRRVPASGHAVTRRSPIATRGSDT